MTMIAQRKPVRPFAVLGFAAVLAAAATAATASEKILHSFRGGNGGANPYGGLIADNQGNLYGTAENGGSGCQGGCGVIFQLAPGRKETVLYAFQGGVMAMSRSARCWQINRAIFLEPR